MQPTPDRPRISIAPQGFDLVLEGLAVLGLILSIALPAFYFDQLPERIPQHFNFKGEPDAYGPRSNIWLPPVIGLVLFTGMSILNRYPHIFNYPVRITEDNAEKYYRLATRLIRGMKAFVMFLFAFVIWQTIQMAIG